MLKTLAAKHQSTVSKMAAKHKAKIETRHGLRTCFEARVHRNGKPDLVARFGGIPLVRDKDAVLIDRIPQPAPHPGKELIHRLLNRRCELCGDPGKVVVHQVRKLTSLGAAGPNQPAWAAFMAGKRRKTLVVCTPATTPSTPTLSLPRRRSSESHILGNGPAWFGGGPRGKGSPHGITSPRGLSCGLPDRPSCDLRADRASLRGRRPRSGLDLLRPGPAPDPPYRHRDGGHSPLRTGLTGSRSTWPCSPRCSSPNGASAPAPARSNGPDTTATGSRSQTSPPAPAIPARPQSRSADSHPEQLDQLRLRGIGSGPSLSGSATSPARTP